MVIGDLIAPETGLENSWKKAYVYGFDKIQDPTNDQFWLVFYNGRFNGQKHYLWWLTTMIVLMIWTIRDGWLVGREAVGVSRLDKSVLDLPMSWEISKISRDKYRRTWSFFSLCILNTKCKHTTKTNPNLTQQCQKAGAVPLKN